MTALVTEIRAFLKESKKCSPGPCAWQLCYEHFGNNSGNDTEKSALHLAAFLASWGMMRGSSFLAKHNFTVHQPIIKIIFGENHGVPQGLTISELQGHQTAILDLAERIRRYYRQVRCGEKDPTDTLVSKILLATLGCSVGYDRFVRAGLGQQVWRQKRLPMTFNKRGLEKFYEWSKLRSAELNQVESDLRSEGMLYPHMKLLDMYFTSVGKQALKDEIGKQSVIFL